MSDYPWRRKQAAESAARSADELCRDIMEEADRSSGRIRCIGPAQKVLLPTTKKHATPPSTPPPAHLLPPKKPDWWDAAAAAIPDTPPPTPPEEVEWLPPVPWPDSEEEEKAAKPDAAPTAVKRMPRPKPAAPATPPETATALAGRIEQFLNAAGFIMPAAPVPATPPPAEWDSWEQQAATEVAKLQAAWEADVQTPTEVAELWAEAEPAKAEAKPEEEVAIVSEKLPDCIVTAQVVAVDSD